jgi:heat shock protein HslJ
MMQKHILLMLTSMLVLLAACGAPGNPGMSPSALPASPTGASASPTATGNTGLDGTEWTLISLNGSDVIEGTTITLSFTDGQVGGNAGCNSYGGQYTATNETLTITDIVSTMMACTSPAGINEQESARILMRCKMPRRIRSKAIDCRSRTWRAIRRWCSTAGKQPQNQPWSPEYQHPTTPSLTAHDGC